MSELLARLSPLPDPDPDDAFHYWDYKELNERKIVASRTDLHRKQRLFGFPAATILTGGRAPTRFTASIWSRHGLLSAKPWG